MHASIRQWRRLVRHFLEGLIDNDLIAPNEDMHASIAGVLSLFLVGTATVALMLLGKYNSVQMKLDSRMGPAAVQTLADKVAMAVDDKALLIGLVMSTMALLAAVFWDALALDDRDLAVLGPLPIRPATVLLAKAAAVTAAAVVLVAALNVLPALLLPTVVLANADVSGATVLRWALAHAVAGCAGCAWAFCTVSAVRGLMGLLLPRRTTDTAFPVIQFALVFVFLCALVSWPTLAGRTRAAVEGGDGWILLLPPMWFLGVEELLIGRTTPVLAELSGIAVKATGASVGAWVVMHLLTLFLKNHRAGTAAGSPASAAWRLLSACAQRVARMVADDGRARASLLFTVRTLTRHPRHRLYLAMAIGLGAAVSCATMAAGAGGLRVRGADLDATTMALAAQLNLVFFLVVGIRMAIAVPADLDAGWIFRFHATAARERYLAGTRAGIFCLFVLPLLVCLAPLHWALWGWYAATVHFAFGVVAALMLLEVVFADYRKLPFVSAFTPGRTVFSWRLPIYVLGYAVFVWLMPAAEWVLVERAGMVYVWMALLVVVVIRLRAAQSSRYKNDALPLFDDDEAADVQTLGVVATSVARQEFRVEDARQDGRSDGLGSLATSRLFGASTDRSVWGAVGQRVVAFRTGGLDRLVSGARTSMSGLRRDVRLAVRRLVANPGFTVFSIATLALGIGGTTAIHSVLYSTVLRPLDVPYLERLVNVYHLNPQTGASRSWVTLSYPDFDDLRRTQSVFSGVLAYSGFRSVGVVQGVGERVLGECVSGTYFSVLGVHPAIGRLLQPADERPSAPPVAVISDRFWRRRFDARPDVVGRTIMLGGHTLEIVGVAPPAFRGTELPNLSPTSVWVTLSHASLVGVTDDLSDRDRRFLFVKGRLAPHRTVSQAAAEVAIIARRLDTEHPLGQRLRAYERVPGASSRPWAMLPSGAVLVTPTGDAILSRFATLTMVAVGLVLLVACSNLANLMIARGASRRRDVGVRLALGASRWQVVREQLVESAIVATLGATFAIGVVRVVAALGQGTVLRFGPWLSLDLAPRYDVGVVVAGLFTSFLALVVFGVGPAVHLTRLELRSVLEGGSQAVGRPAWRGRRLLIAAQVAVSVALVAVAGLGFRYMIQVTRQSTGVDLDRLAVVGFDFSTQGWDEARARRALERLVEETRRLPHVEAVAASSGLPTGLGTRRLALTTPDRPFDTGSERGHLASLLVVTPSTLDAFGGRLLSGRFFEDRDTATSTPVVVLSEVAARTLFGRADVVGREVLRRKSVPGKPDPTIETLTIIGVVADTTRRSDGQRLEGAAYLPFAQQYSPSLMIVVRTSGRAADAVTGTATLSARLEPQLAIVEAGTGLAVAGVESLAISILVRLAGLLGLVALALAMVGLYGVLSFIVAARAYELGVRAALGARASQMVGMVMKDGLLPVVGGIVAGLAVADLAEIHLRAQTFLEELPSLDPVLVAAIPLPFLLAAGLACYLPARRAARVAPNVALRQM